MICTFCYVRVPPALGVPYEIPLFVLSLALKSGVNYFYTKEEKSMLKPLPLPKSSKAHSLD